MIKSNGKIKRIFLQVFLLSNLSTHVHVEGMLKGLNSSISRQIGGKLKGLKGSITREIRGILKLGAKKLDFSTDYRSGECLS